MRRFLILAAWVIGLSGVASVSIACTRSDRPIFVFFGSGSFELSSQALNTLKMVLPVAQYKAGLPKRCERLMVTGNADTAEALTPEIRIDVSRAEAVRTAFLQYGILAEHISVEGGMGGPNLIPTGPGVREPQNRNVVVWWQVSKGRWRCDPSTKNETYNPAACQGEYGRCYYELTDGTACNFDGVPNPDPAKYSVILGR
jgi:hypothetical protein